MKIKLKIKKNKKEKTEDIFKDDDLPSKWKMRKKINTLEGEVEVLKEYIKDELYIKFMEKLGESDKVKRLTEDNKKLRIQVKKLKEDLKNGYSQK